MFFLFLSIILASAFFIFRAKGNQPGMVGCVLLLIALAISMPFVRSSVSDQAAKFDRKDKGILARVVAETVVDRHPGKRVVLVVSPVVDGLPEVVQMINPVDAALEAAFRKLKVDLVVHPLPFKARQQNQLETLAGSWDPEDEDYSLEMAYATALWSVTEKFSHQDVNALVKDFTARADVIVLSFDLINTVNGKDLLPRGEGPELVLIKAPIEDQQEALATTVLDMVVAYRPNGDWEIDKEWPKTIQEAFDARYVIATREDPEPNKQP